MNYKGGAILFVPRAIRKVVNILRGSCSNMLLHMACKNVGKGAKFMPGVWVMEPSAVEVGANSLIATGVSMSTEISGMMLKISSNVQINSNVMLDHTGGLRIGSNVLISEDVLIYTHDHGLDPRSKPRPLEKIIEDDVWVGARCIVLPSCRSIGRGAVIGAGSILTKDVPEYAICAGNPARVIGMVGEK